MQGGGRHTRLVSDWSSDVCSSDLTDHPCVSYLKDGVGHDIACDFIAGCDGFHGVSRASVKPSAIETFERIYPFGWLGILSETPPVSNERSEERRVGKGDARRWTAYEIGQ